MKKQTQHLAIAMLAVAISNPLFGGCADKGDRASTPSTPPISATAASIVSAATPNLPAQQLPVAGWLAFGTRPTKDGKAKFPFSPSNSAAQVAIFSKDWGQVKAGTPLVALAPGFKGEVKFRRSAKEPYGCDDTPTDMATFISAKPVPEGPVWLLPASAANAATAVPLEPLSLEQVPTSLLPANKRQPTQARAWKAGSATILLQKVSDYKVKLTVANNSQAVFSTEAQKYFFEGETNKKPVDLSGRYEPGIPQPVGAFQLTSGATPAIALWFPGYEGHTFKVLAPAQGKVQLVEVGQVYYCAY